MSEKPSAADRLQPWEVAPEKLDNPQLAGLVNVELLELAEQETEAGTAFAELESKSNATLSALDTLRAAEKRMYTRVIAALTVAAIGLVDDVSRIESKSELVYALAIAFALFEIFTYLKQYPKLNEKFYDSLREFKATLPQGSYLGEYRRRQGSRASIAKIKEIRVMMDAQAAASRLEKPKRGLDTSNSSISRLELPSELDSDGMQESLSRLLEDPGSDGESLRSYRKPSNQ
jgi:hypothetical protein